MVAVDSSIEYIIVIKAIFEKKKKLSIFNGIVILKAIRS